MINEKKEIRVINDLELKDVSGGFLMFAMFSLATLFGLSVAVSLNPPRGNSGS